MDQWGYRALAIIVHMMGNNEVSADGLVDYLKYMQTTFRFFHRYTRPSVLLYDKEFQEAQRQEGFPWGSSRRDLQYFQLTLKSPRLPEHVASNGGNKQRRRGPFLPTGKEICRRFNVESCDRERFYCKLAHTCSLCFAMEHPATIHPVQAKK